MQPVCAGAEVIVPFPQAARSAETVQHMTRVRGTRTEASVAVLKEAGNARSADGRAQGGRN